MLLKIACKSVPISMSNQVLINWKLVANNIVILKNNISYITEVFQDKNHCYETLHLKKYLLRIHVIKNTLVCFYNSNNMHVNNCKELDPRIMKNGLVSKNYDFVICCFMECLLSGTVFLFPMASILFLNDDFKVGVIILYNRPP